MSDRDEATKPTSGSVLVAQGDRPTRELFATTLANAGFHLDVASDGLEAIGRLETRDYDAVIVDLHLTRTDAMGVLQFIAERHPSIFGSVVLVTGLALPEIGALYPICATLPKPVSPSRLLDVVRTCLNRRKPEV
jgi:DNA-binding response OmpR family regulator